MCVNDTVIDAANVSPNYDNDITEKIIEEILKYGFRCGFCFLSLWCVLIVIVIIAPNQTARSWVYTTLVKSLGPVYTALVKIVGGRRGGSQETRGSSQADSSTV